MFVPHSVAVALLMMITSAVCWGSWANTYKGVRNYRFEFFYWDYAFGIFLISVILAFTMGSAAQDSTSFLNNVRMADGLNFASTLLGGALFNLANLLLVAGIDMAGLAIAFPVSIGIALVGEPVRFGDFFRGPMSGHMLGLLGGCIWGIGTVFNLVAANFTGVPISYAIGQSAPMVAALWGVLVWKEFQGANNRAKMYLGLMFVFYVFAIMLVSLANIST